ncbi:MAG TPA: hydrolase 1, exosortase A system-associated [Rhodocyclaceae bacterium]|nr:hydrolase 1, exosortase A system-associated [Rhodocyclaceae bacterium]
MKYIEQPLVFPCAGDELVGILARPERSSAIGVVIVVGGPQYRAGSHRQFVLLARALAAAGYPVLRFDYRGMGDSGGEARNFEAAGQDIGAAINALLDACPEVGRVVLWGLCDGASAALLYCHETADGRVDGLVLANPWVRSETTLARTQVKHYYGQRLLQREFWAKLLRGELAVGKSLLGLWRTVRLSRAGQGAAPARRSFQAAMAEAWRKFPGAILVVLSGQDYVAKEFMEYAKSDPGWTGLLERKGVRRALLTEADHTFSAQTARHQVEAIVVQWLQQQEWGAERQRLAG